MFQHKLRNIIFIILNFTMEKGNQQSPNRSERTKIRRFVILCILLLSLVLMLSFIYAWLLVNYKPFFIDLSSRFSARGRVSLSVVYLFIVAVPFVSLIFLYSSFTKYTQSINCKNNTRLFIVMSVILFISSNYYFGSRMFLQENYGKIFSLIEDKSIISSNLLIFKHSVYEIFNDFSFVSFLLKSGELLIMIIPALMFSSETEKK